MTTQAAEVQIEALMRERLTAAEPGMSLLHHMAATQAMEIGFTVILVDESSYRATRGDHVFTDGLSVVVDGHRRYFPLTAVKEIVVHNPNDS